MKNSNSSYIPATHNANSKEDLRRQAESTSPSDKAHPILNDQKEKAAKKIDNNFELINLVSNSNPNIKSDKYLQEDSANSTENKPAFQPMRRAGKRRRARELALQTLYAMEVSGQEALESIQRIRECFNYSESSWEYAFDLIMGVEKNKKEIDTVIQRASEHWSLHRMALVDRNLLRLAIYELMFCLNIPKKVAINEAVDLAKKFGSEDSGAFINGVLDKAASILEK